MSRDAVRRSAVRSIVLAMACMMAVSIVGVYGHVFPCDRFGKSVCTVHPGSGSHPEEAGEDGADAQGAGPFPVGIEALHESFAPEFLPPGDGGPISPGYRLSRGCAYLPRIYRPPII